MPMTLPSAIDLKSGIDKHVEYLANWERGLVQEAAPAYGISLSSIILDLM